MIRRIVKLVVSTLVWACDGLRSGLVRLCGRKPPGRAVILYYHGIRPQDGRRFAAQMDALLRRAAPIPADWRGPLASGVCHAAVTFDDGFAGVLDNALPALKARGIPATLFVPSGFLSKAPGWLTDPRSAAGEVVLTPRQLRALGGEPLVTIGSHAVSHRRLTSVPTAEAEQELRASLDDLSAAWGRRVELLSFPHGAFDAGVLDAARAAGYRAAFGIFPECARETLNGFLRGRVAVNPSDWPWEFRLKIMGAYRWQGPRTAMIARQSHDG